MKIKTRTVDRVVIVELSGALEPDADGLISSEIERIISGGQRSILVNMGQVPVVDSAVLGELLAAKKAALVGDAEIKLLRPTRQAYGVLAQAKLENIFDCFDDESTAVGSFEA